MSTLPQLVPVRQLGLDDLWAEAETLGNLHIRTSYSGFRESGQRKGYQVTLSGKRKNTELKIEREHTSLVCAIADAINEAREMGLGEQS